MPSRARRRDAAATATPSQTHLAGLIMWLPRRDAIAVPTRLPNGCYHHPVVILSPRPLDSKVVILILTSLGNEDLAAKYPRNKELRQFYLPIHPSKPHPDLNVLLWVDKSLVLRRNSYANLREQHAIPFNALRAYEQERPTIRYALTKDSYQTLITHAGFSVPVESPLHNITAPPTRQDPTISPEGMDRVASVSVEPRAQQVSLLRTHGATGPTSAAERLPNAPDRSVEPSYGTVSVSRRDRRIDRQRHASTTGRLTIPVVGSAGRVGHHLPLPTPHNSRRRPPDGGTWSKMFQVLLILSVIATIFGTGFFGLWKAWAYRARLVKALWQGIRWSGVQAFRVGKAAVIAGFRALS